MKKLLAIMVLGLLWSENSYAYGERKHLLCKDEYIIPETNNLNIKNRFFSSVLDNGEVGEVLTISYRDKITKLWANEMSNIVQFTLIDDGDEYDFEYPKNVFDASTPHWLKFKEKTFMELSTGDIYKFIEGSLNKLTLRGTIMYKLENPGTNSLSPSKTKDILSVRFKCEIIKPKI